MIAIGDGRNLAAAMSVCAGLCAVLLACSGSNEGTPPLAQGGAQNGAHAGGAAGGGIGGAGSGGASANATSGGMSAANGGVSATSGGVSVSYGGTSGGAAGGRTGALGGSTSSQPAGGSSARGGNVGAGGSGARGGGTSAGGTSAMGGAIALGGSASGGAVGAAGATNSGILVPQKGILLGAFYGDASLSATSGKLGRTLPVHLTYYAWDDEWASGDTKADLNAGRIPLVNWELFGATLDDISGGTYDSLLAQRAKEAKALGKKFFLDFGAEMNGDWSPWGGAQNGSSATKYLAAYRHAHDALVAGGATNVVWVWCPNVTDEPNESWNHALEYYPGDSYVDWTCVDGYNWGTSNGDRWQSFHDVFATIYPKLAAKNKPILIGEMASAEVGGDKAAWISAMVPSLKSDFPMIKGLVWFDINKETDWRISSSSASEAAFVKMANDPYMNQ